MATSYSNLGEYEKSKELDEKVYEARVRVLGEEHPDTLSSFLDLAACYYKLGKYEKSREMFKKLYDIYLRVLGKEHIKTVKIHDIVEAFKREHNI